MKNTKLILTLAFAFFATILQAQTIDTDKSEVKFDAGNMVFSTVSGHFTGMTGEINFDASDLATSKFDVCIDASTIFTDNKKRDDHLRNPDFFEVKKYPTICIKSTSITKKGSNYILKANLTMHGITKEVEFPFSNTNGIFQGELALNRSDYKLGEDTNTFMLSEEIEIEIICHTK